MYVNRTLHPWHIVRRIACESLHLQGAGCTGIAGRTPGLCEGEYPGQGRAGRDPGRGQGATLVYVRPCAARGARLTAGVTQWGVGGTWVTSWGRTSWGGTWVTSWGRTPNLLNTSSSSIIFCRHHSKQGSPGIDRIKQGRKECTGTRKGSGGESIGGFRGGLLRKRAVDLAVRRHHLHQVLHPPCIGLAAHAQG